LPSRKFFISSFSFVTPFSWIDISSTIAMLFLLIKTNQILVSVKVLTEVCFDLI
jgi:hypothetical protein